MKKNKCLFIHCGSYNRLTPVITMGLWGLADLLTRNGYETRILHTGIEKNIMPNSDLASYIDEKTLFVGCSAHWFPMVAESIDTLQQVKAIFPDVFTLLGGYSASFFAKDIMENFAFVSGIIRGDAEIPLLELVKKLEAADKNLADIPNLAWRSNNTIVYNNHTYISNENIYDSMDLAGFDKYLINIDKAHDYFRTTNSLIADFFPTEFDLDNTFYLLTGKGCTVNCSICGGGKTAQQLVNNRTSCMFLKKEKIVATIKSALKQGFNNFYVCYDPYPDEPRYYDYLEEIRKEKLDINFFFGFWKLPTTEQIQTFKRTTKNLYIDISPESITESVRKITKAGNHYTNKEFYDCVEMLYREKVYTMIYFCYFLPSETRQDILETRNAYWKLNVDYPHYIEAAYIKISTDPASPLYIKPEKYDVTLSIANFMEHLEVSRQATASNIIVHELNTISKDDQQVIVKTLAFDNCLKFIFKYNIKYMAKAFESIDEFLRYLDGFYNKYNLISGAPPFETKDYDDVITYLMKYTEELIASAQFKIKPYLLSLLEYVRGRVSILLKDIEQGNLAEFGPDSGELVLSLCRHCNLVSLEYDIYSASEALLAQKVYREITPKENFLLFIKKDNTTIDIFDINESLYDLLTAIKNNRERSLTKLIAEVAELYTDDATIENQIENEMLFSLQELNKLRIFRQKD